MKPAKLAAEAPPTSPPPRRTALSAAWDALTSLKLTIACLAALMVLVVACTLAQVHLGTYGAVQKYMRAWLVWWDIPGTVLSLPVFPAGALTGLVLLVNLVASQLRRLEISWKKSGLWIVHLGLITLVAAEFVSAVFQRESQLELTGGQPGKNYVNSPSEVELAVIDRSDPQLDEVWSIPQSLLRDGAVVQVPGRPIALRVVSFLENSRLDPAPQGQGQATAGAGVNRRARPVPATSRDDERNLPSVVVERVGARTPSGQPETWLASVLVGQPQPFTQDGRTYTLEMRLRREYLPYAITLRKFSHDIYPGTDIPKNFSSLVYLKPAAGEGRDVLIKMNQPLRYAGKTFYQASYRGENTTVLQVVENPGWLLPYASCLLVAVGLLVHFGIALGRWVRSQSTGADPAGSPEATT